MRSVPSSMAVTAAWRMRRVRLPIRPAVRWWRRKARRGEPHVVVTDKLASYGAAHREIMLSVEHRSPKGLNNRAENSHLPTRERERAVKGFRSPGSAQRFLSAFSGISPHLRPRRHLLTATRYRAEMTIRFAIRDQITGTITAPRTA
ncbi:hypothetical protein ABIA38_009182 [Embleya sp. AB8]